MRGLIPVGGALRGALWAAGGPARLALIGLIRVYRLTLSGFLGGQCRFHPTCSVYAEEAVRVHGAIKGAALAAWRVIRCGPFSRGGVDPVAPRRAGGRGTYEAIIRHQTAGAPR